MSERTGRAAFVGIAVLAAMVRLAECVWSGAWTDPLRSEPTEEVRLAQGLAAGRGFVTPFLPLPESPGASQPSAFSPPGFPLVLAGCIRICECLEMGRLAPYRLAMAVSILVSVVGVLILAAAGHVRWGCRGFWSAGLLAVLWPSLVRNSFALWDTPVAVLGVCCCGFVLAAPGGFLERHGFQRKVCLAGAGLALGILALFNPLVVPLGVVAVVYALWDRREPVAAFRRIAWVGLVSAACVAPWLMRHAVVFGRFIPVRNSLGFNIWVGNIADADGTSARTYSSQPIQSLEEQRLVRELGEDGYMRRRDRDAREVIRGDPRRFLHLTARRFALFWLGDYRRATRVLGVNVPSFGGVNVLKSLANLVLIGLAVVGSVKGLSRVQGGLCWVGVFLLSWPYYVMHTSSTYRVAVDPLLVFMAAGSVVMCLQWLRNHGDRGDDRG